MKIDVPSGTVWFRRVALVPQPGGREKIAQRLIAGREGGSERVPPGTAESFPRHKGDRLFRPFGTWWLPAPVSSDESLGYARSSLRDCRRLIGHLLCSLIVTSTLGAVVQTTESSLVINQSVEREIALTQLTPTRSNSTPPITWRWVRIGRTSSIESFGLVAPLL